MDGNATNSQLRGAHGTAGVDAGWAAAVGVSLGRSEAACAFDALRLRSNGIPPALGDDSSPLTGPRFYPIRSPADPLAGELFAGRSFADCAGLAAEQIARMMCEDGELRERVHEECERLCMVPLEEMERRVERFSQAAAADRG